MLAKNWQFWMVVIAIVLGLLYWNDEMRTELVGAVDNIQQDAHDISEKLTSSFSFGGLLGNSRESKSKYPDLLRSPGALAQAMTDFKKKNGNSMIAFERIDFSSSEFSFSRQDPANPENLDRYEYSVVDGWKNPKPRKSPDAKELARSLMDLNQIPWEHFPDMITRCEKFAEDQGVVEGKVRMVICYPMREKSTIPYEPYWVIKVENDRKEIWLRVDAKGTKIEKSR